MEIVRLVEVAPGVDSPRMREAAGVMLRYLDYAGQDYTHDDSEVDRYIRQSGHKGEVHRMLLDGSGKIVAVTAEGPEEETGTVDLKRMAVVGDRQRQRDERYGTRAVLGVARVALRDGKQRLNVFSRGESAPFYAEWLGFTVVNEARRQMVIDAQLLCERFPELASERSIIID